MVKKILIVNHPLQDSDNELNIVQLKHPKSNELRSFLLVSSDLYELITLNQDGNSLFIDDYVQSDYQCVIATKFDFKYFLISLSAQNPNDFAAIDDLKQLLVEQTLSDQSLSKSFTHFLKTIKIEEDLSCLFDVRKSANNVEIKYNQEKCLDYLKRKVELLQIYLEKAHSSNEKQSKDYQEKSKTDAFELICQYVSSNLAGALRKHLGLSSPFESNENHKRSKTSETIIIN